MSHPLDSDWFDSQSDHALACARYGDCIFTVVQEGAADIQDAWARAARPWSRLIDKAVRGKVFGLMPPLTDRKWLMYVLLMQSPSRWPSGLSKEEVELLKMARVVSQYYPLAVQDVPGGSVGAQPDTEEATLKALKSYAALFKKDIALSMWKTYVQVAAARAAEIMPLCDTVYKEPCSLREAEQMFKGDLERGWKMDSVGFSPASEKVFPLFIDWVTQ